MKILSRITALALCAGITTAATGCGKKSESSSAPAEPQTITGTYTYISGEDTTATFFYSDAYFAGSGKTSDEHLRTMSLALTLTAFGSSGDNNTANAEELLGNIGFSTEDISAEQYDETPTRDSIATIISHRKTPCGEVVAVAVRGADYRAEWANNFLSGETGDALGFSQSADKVIARIKAYEEQYGLSGAKLWITGYSRGGAVSDLCGKYINEHPDEFGITADDLYVYTFEAPRASSTACGYENIHNVLDPNDLVPKVYPEGWGFYNCGVAELLRSEEILIQPMKIEVLKGGFSPSETDADPVSVSSFEDSFIDFLAENVTRETFSACSEHIGDIIAVYSTKNGEEREQLTEFLSNSFSGAFGGGTNGSATLMLALMLDEKGSEKYNTDLGALSGAIAGSISEADHSGFLTDDEYKMISEGLPDMISVLVPVMLTDFKGEVSFGMFGTFMGNMAEILTQHQPDAILGMVQALDSYY